MTAPIPPGKAIGDIINKTRKELSVTQDEYGARHSVSGPAIFKFEKGYVRPSLPLWLAMAADADVSERRAVLLWVRSKLPQKYQRCVELPPARPKQRRGVLDYSTVERREEMRAAATKDTKLPKALRDSLNDDDLWQLFKPTGHEINLVRDMFGGLGRVPKSTYRDALRLVREFCHSF